MKKSRKPNRHASQSTGGSKSGPPKRGAKPNHRSRPGGPSYGARSGGPNAGARSGGRHRRGPADAEGSPPRGRAVVGIHAVRELLKVRPREIDQLWVRDRYTDHPELTELHDLAKSKHVPVRLQNPAVLDRVIASHQGILAFTPAGPELDFAALASAETATLVALDEVEDPHNLGAILRTCWLFGVQGILTPENRAADLSPAVSKVAQGAAEHIPVVRDSALPERLKQLKEHGFWILGLSHKAEQNLFQFEVPAKVVWVLGSESSGLRKSVEKACDDLISIPQSNPDASYNVSVAAAVALAESFRQRAGG